MLSVPSARPDYVGWGGEWGREGLLFFLSSSALMKPPKFCLGPSLVPTLLKI